MVNRAAEAVKREVFDPMIREDFFEQRHEPLTEGLGKFLCHTIIRQAPVGFSAERHGHLLGASLSPLFLCFRQSLFFAGAPKP